MSKFHTTHTHTHTHTQLKAYQEDFDAERRDKERLASEKQNSALKYEAELTSLRLQLDRCRNDLAHYTAEATRLSQQLKLKSQYEEEQYRKHLESKVGCQGVSMCQQVWWCVSRCGRVSAGVVVCQQVWWCVSRCGGVLAGVVVCYQQGGMLTNALIYMYPCLLMYGYVCP